MANGHKLVIGHRSQKNTIHTSKKDQKRHLSQTAPIGDDSAVSLDVHNHLWDGGRGKTDVSHGKVGEKEVHGVWMWGSKLTVKMISRFPYMATRYMDRKSPESRG